MDCEHIKKLIPRYIENDLQPDDLKWVKDHLSDCKTCQKQAVSTQQAWHLLGEIHAIEPNPNYVSRFWTTVSTQSPWYEELIMGVKHYMADRRFVPAMVTACLFILVGTISLNIYQQNEVSQQQLAGINQEDADLQEDLELVDNLDLLEDLDIYETLVEIDDLDLEILDIEDIMSNRRIKNEKKTIVYHDGLVFDMSSIIG
jgi:hypothetical protein